MGPTTPERHSKPTYPDIPKHIVENFGDKRTFKSEKRMLIREALKTLNDLRTGCLFMADNGDKIIQAAKLLEQAKEDHSVENWGR